MNDLLIFLTLGTITSLSIVSITAIICLKRVIRYFDSGHMFSDVKKDITEKDYEILEEAFYHIKRDVFELISVSWWR